MYEDVPKDNKPVNTTIIKIAICIFAIIIAVLLFTFTTKANAPISDEEKEFNTNLDNFKLAVITHYKVDKPNVLNGEDTISLSEILNKEILKEFTYNEDNCNLNNSYAKITKVNDNDYSLRVQLDCNNNNEFLITTIN